ncbi:MAG: hypothetical protein ACWA5X_13865 [bacterium]
MTEKKRILFINEYGIYPELIRGLQASGHDVNVEHLMRKAISFIKKKKPDVVVAEFAHEGAFRDRVSNLESMLAQIQGGKVPVRTVVMYEPDRQEYLDNVRTMFDIDQVLVQPVGLERLLSVIDGI